MMRIGNKNHPASRILAGFCLLAGLISSGSHVWGQEIVPGDAQPSKAGRVPLVVLKQAEVQGRVFFLSEEGTSDTPAAKLSVKVEDPARGLLLFSSKTDTQGKFVLPNMEAGLYKLTLGRFSLELLVVQMDEEALKLKPVPKTLLVLIPEMLKD